MLLTLYFLLPLTIAEDSWTVRTEYGDLRGSWSSDTNVWEFRGIPYAGPPTGQNRFKAPIPPTSWTGVRDANVNTIMCQQVVPSGPNVVQGIEDCLIINVFVPESGKSGEPLPVLFYIHGGGFIYGHSNGHNPAHTTRHDVILVTFNYRLGPIGFLCLGTENIPGNAGLKDQVAALQWIQNNIEHFGGDPNAVTIYGDSAGAGSAEALVLSRATDGLFHRAIVESGSALTDWALSYSRLGLAKGAALQLGFGPVDNLTLLEQFYISAPADDVFQVNGGLLSNTRRVPCIERKFDDSMMVVYDSFRNIIEEGDYVKVPIMFVYADLEGLSFAGNFINIIDVLQNSFEMFLPIDLYFATAADKTMVANSVRNVYFGNQSITIESARGYVDYLTDISFVTGMYRSAVQHSKNSDNPVYIMEFAYRGGFNRPNTFFPELIGAGHSDMLAYVLDLGYSNPETLEQDQIIRDRMTEMWTNFVKYGNPTPSNTNSLLPVVWEPFTVDHESYLWMGSNMELRHSPLSDRMKLWVDIYDQYYLPPPAFEQGNSANFVYKLSMLLFISCICFIVMCHRTI